MANFLHWNGTCQQNFWKLVSHAIIISKRIRYLALPDIASHQHNSWSISLKVNLLLNELKDFLLILSVAKRGSSGARTESIKEKLEKLECSLQVQIFHKSLLAPLESVRISKVVKCIALTLWTSIKNNSTVLVGLVSWWEVLSSWKKTLAWLAKPRISFESQIRQLKYELALLPLATCFNWSLWHVSVGSL